MSKFVILGDTHFSVRNGDKRFVNYFDKVYTDWFFPELKKRGLKKIIQVGDLFDKRTGNDSFAVSESKRYFFDKLCQDGCYMWTLLGNHDLYFKNSLDVSSPELLLDGYQNITIINKPTKIGSLDFIPWICDENRAKVFQFIKDSESKFCFGHFEITGFSMYKGVKGQDGLSPTIFNKYDGVFSGHYHTASKQLNIQYTGSPAEYTWSDADDPKGFWIFDDETGETEFVVNPFTMFTKVFYDEEDIGKFDFTTLTDKFVRLYVINNKDLKKYDKFVQNINESNPHELKIIEEGQSAVSDVDTENIDVRDTPSLIEQYIDGLETDLDKERLKKMMRKLYVEAQSEE